MTNSSCHEAKHTTKASRKPIHTGELTTGKIVPCQLTQATCMEQHGETGLIVFNSSRPEIIPRPFPKSGHKTINIKSRGLLRPGPSWPPTAHFASAAHLEVGAELQQPLQGAHRILASDALLGAAATSRSSSAACDWKAAAPWPAVRVVPWPRSPTPVPASP